jgi:hypothetical protein
MPENNNMMLALVDAKKIKSDQDEVSSLLLMLVQDNLYKEVDFFLSWIE